MGELTPEECDRISECTLEFVRRQVLSVLQGAIQREAQARLAGGEAAIPGHKLTIGACVGAVAAALEMDWGFLHDTATPKDLLDQYQALLPVLSEDVLVGPPGMILKHRLQKGMAAVQPMGRA